MKAERNKGFTLIEVIVSMLILTIVAVPLISTFYTSASANRRTAKNQNASLAAQSIMEMAKGYDIEAFPSAVRTAIATGAGIDAGEITVDGGAVTRDESGNSLEGVHLTDKYVYEMKNILFAGDSYEARITYDANAYRDVEAPAGSTAPITPKWNNFEILDVYNVDSKNSVLIGSTKLEVAMFESYTARAIDYFWQIYSAKRDSFVPENEDDENPFDRDGIYSPSDMEKYIQRTVSLVLDCAGTAGDAKVRMSIEYDAHGEIYDMEGEFQTYTVYGDDASSRKTINADDFQRIYLFYDFFKRSDSRYNDIIDVSITPELREYYSRKNPDKEIGIYIILPDRVVDSTQDYYVDFVLNGNTLVAGAQIGEADRNSWDIKNLRFYSQKSISNIIEKKDDGSSVADMFKEKDPINRIYNIKVEVFEKGALSGPGDPVEKRIAVMESAKTR